MFADGTTQLEEWPAGGGAGRHRLSISVDADPDDPRVDDAGTDFLPGWGLHLSDVQLAHGDLVRLAKKQADMWLED